jgi:eukaryotic-like serine/threonine-protein kinase
MSQDALGLIGTVVDQKYRVEGVIGEGGFSVVYRAEHIIWKQPVALKCFNTLANVPPSMREELLNGFIQEGKLMTSLSTRTAAIVQARDVGTLTAPATGAQVPFMVLEWLEGRPLDKILFDERGRGAPPRTIFDVMALLEPVTSALEVAHSHNIAHRDIKPANLFVIGDPRGAGAFVKILDFGIAKVMAEHAQLSTSLAQTGKEITAFTPNYGAPEQYSRTHGATGPWTDVFALALIMVEMLAGTPALQGDDYIQLAVASRDPSVRPTPRALGVEISDEVERVFRKALAVSPHDRYKTAGQFWTELHGAAFPGSPMWAPVTTGGMTQGGNTGPRPSMVVDTGPGMRGAPSAPTTLFATGGTADGVAGSTARPAGGGGKAVFGAVAAAAILGGAGGAFFFFRSKETPKPEVPIAPVPSATAEPSVVAPVPITCDAGMVEIKGGRFFMGSDDDGFPLWRPAHNVTLSPYCIGINEVTVEEYKACVDQGACKRAATVPDYPKSEKTTPDQHDTNRKAFAELCNFGENGAIKPGREKHPVNCVSWEMADRFCKVRGGRLPTEAEWEFAARGSDGRKFPWGDDPGKDAKHMNACGKECKAWEATRPIQPKSETMHDEDDGFPGTAPVGSFPKGETLFKLHDMVGNVWEWTNDYYDTYKSGDVVDPQGAAAGERKAIRGGGFNGGFELWVNPAFRYHQDKTATAHGIGFRCAKPLTPPKG